MRDNLARLANLLDRQPVPPPAVRVFLPRYEVTATVFTDGTVKPPEPVGESPKERWGPPTESKPPGFPNGPPPEGYLDGTRNWTGNDGSMWKWNANRGEWVCVFELGKETRGKTV